MLHYVFNWVEESLNIIINDFQFINYLFCLIPIDQSDIFIECTTILEDLLTIKTKSMLDLKKIPILKRVVTHCSDSQFPFLCRVIAVIMSDNEITKPANDTLKAHDEWLQNSPNNAIGDSNQKFLIHLNSFPKRLIELSMRDIESADNVWEKRENLQSWVASTYVTQNSVNLLRQSLEQIFDADYNRNSAQRNPDEPTPLLKLKIHNEKMYKIEALFILTLLLCGNYKDEVQKHVSKLNLIPGLNKLFKNFIWKSENNDEPPLMQPPNEDCSADTALKVQFLRLVHSVCDHHPNKYLLLSRNELEELKHNNNDNPNIDKIIESNLHCAESEGLLSNILSAMKEAEETSTLRFWIARAVESFLRGPTCKQDQIFYLKRGILDHLLHLLLDIQTSAEVSQGHFDLLAELMKFNESAFKAFEDAVINGDRFDNFMNLAADSLVDSNMFIRCATLTFHKFQRENVNVGESKLLNYMSKQEIRADLIAKLIELITPDTLNQENVSCLNTSLVFMITARRERTLPYYLHELSRRRNSQGVPLLQNYQELLEFWLCHYSLTFKEKDCQSLEQGTGIEFSEWTSTVKILLGKQPPDDDPNEPSLISYLPCKSDRSISRDKSVSRLT